ncbi:flagellar hook-length control protein FliK [Anaerobacillus isosaccharinicus]|uniref:Flagellar hook-length control protein FliK n=1 Tax=Anaerobacillus isosaccharinicus TaxID=1532552 RepID=A0A7S7L4V7_9BACI|nr:flagellar hook-length control protein FliK [Anaerobacillus isosaccharinicus]MBA5587334.1 flagellar hook-length control protein FliK [Anaerobacillus isosaccharinicus]QOY34472.1 flagellar hook-length control protein FliK [Anaerobacillus isosaccharinicus]
MNGINLLQMTALQTAQVTGVTVLNNQSEEKEGAFLKLLETALSEPTLENIISVVPDQDHLSDLHKLVSKFVEELPFSDTVVDEEILTLPLVENLLEQLPLEMQLQIQQVFSNNEYINDIISTGKDYLQDPVQLLAVILLLSQSVEPPTELAPKVQLQLERLLPMLENQSEHSKNPATVKDFQQVVKQLTLNLELLPKEKLVLISQGQKETAKLEQFVLSAFSRTTSDQPTLGSQGITLPPNMALNQLQQFVLHVGENRSEHQNQEQLLRQFQNILGKSSLVQFPNGINKLTIKLFPQHLGRLDVTLTQQNGVIIAQLLTTTKAAKNALDSQLHQLRQAFLGQNIQVEKIEVHTQQQQQTLFQSNQESQEEQRNNQQSKERRENNDNEEKVKFEDLLNEIDAKV